MGMLMDSADDLQEALRPLASLLGKCERAQQKVGVGTWQQAMLGAHVRALGLAVSLIKPDGQRGDFEREALREALGAFGEMIRKTEKALVLFSPGISQFSLLRNRLDALRVGERLMMGELGRV